MTDAVTTRSPREILDLFHRAMIDVSADDLADLYAVDAVHEFPFLSPGRPDRYHGREEVRAGYRAAWAGHPVTLAEIHNVGLHQTADPEVIVNEWSATGSVTATGAPFALSGLLVLRCRDGLLVHVRDYMDSLGVSHALGRLPAVVASLTGP